MGARPLKSTEKNPSRQEKNRALWEARFKSAKSLGFESGAIPKTFSPALKHRLYRAYKAMPKAMAKGGKHAYENARGNYYKFTSLKVSRSEAAKLKNKGEKVYKGRLVVNSSIAYKPTLHRKFKDKVTGKKGLAIVYRETGSGPVTKVAGSNYRIKMIDNQLTIPEFLAALEAGKLPTDKRVNYSVNIGTYSPFKRTFNNPYQLAYYLKLEFEGDYPESFEPKRLIGRPDTFEPKDKKIQDLEPFISISVYGDVRMKPLTSTKR